MALLIAYIVNRRLVPFGEALGFLAMAPFVIPGIVMAIGFYAAYASPPLALYGTAAIIIFAFTARFLPIAYANCSAAVRAVMGALNAIYGAEDERSFLRRMAVSSALAVAVAACRRLLSPRPSERIGAWPLEARRRASTWSGSRHPGGRRRRCSCSRSSTRRRSWRRRWCGRASTDNSENGAVGGSRSSPVLPASGSRRCWRRAPRRRSPNAAPPG